MELLQKSSPNVPSLTPGLSARHRFDLWVLDNRLVSTVDRCPSSTETGSKHTYFATQDRGNHMTDQQISLCARLKGLGFAKGNQVKLYGDVYELVEDPVVVTNSVVLFDATETKSGEFRRVRVPLPIVNMANRQNAA